MTILLLVLDGIREAALSVLISRREDRRLPRERRHVEKRLSDAGNHCLNLSRLSKRDL